MGDQDLGLLQIHLEDPDISDDNMPVPSTDRVLLPAEARATRYGRIQGVSVKVSDTVLG